MRFAGPGVELPAGEVDQGAGAYVMRGWLCQRCRALFRKQSSGEEPVDRAARLGLAPRRRFGTIVPNTGNTLNGLFLSGDGISKTTYVSTSLALAPRFGMAYDLTGAQKFVIRGGGGLFYDRPNGNDIYAQVTNPPAVQNVTVRYAQLQSLSSGIPTVGAPALNVYQYDAKCRRPGSGTAACRWHSRGRARSMWPTPVSTAGTRRRP